MRLLVIGGSGLVGSNVVKIAKNQNHEVHWTSREPSNGQNAHALDKTEEAETKALVSELEPNAIVDTAAFHTVDDCENQRRKAFDVNTVGTRHLATAAETVGTHLVYLSTDYVFSGAPSDDPYTEDNSIAPLNYYAKTKYAGEVAAAIPDDYTVFRPSVIYGTANANFVTWVLGEFRDGNEVSIVDDQISRPTYAPDLARACVQAINDGLHGTYHATGPTSLSRFEFTRQLADAFGFDESLVNPITTEELGQSAPRPANSSLNSTSLYTQLGWRFDAPRKAFDRMRIEGNN